MTIEPDAWLLGDPGRQIPLDSWHASFDERGCLRAGGRVSAEVAYRAEQGAPLTAVLNDEPVWDGTTSRPPLVDRGQAQLEAQGHRRLAEKATTPLLYQSREVGLWTPRDSNPFNSNPTGKQKYGIQVRDGSLAWHIENAIALATGDLHGFVVAARGSPGGITRYAFDWISTVATTLLQLKTSKHDYPFTGIVGVADHGINATSGSVDQAIATAKEVLDLRLECISAVGSSTVYDLVAWNLRVNGIASGDTLYTSDVVKDAGGRLGCDVSKVQSSNLNAMPFYFQGGGNWMDGVFAYMADLDDWAPPFFGPDRGSGCELRYAPWGSVVLPVSLARDIRPDLVSLELYNRVTVTYPHIGGTTESVTVTPADIDENDPLATYGIVNELPHISLRDPQPDDTLARAVGMNALRRVIRPRHQGRGELASVSDATVWDALPGCHAEFTDWGPMESMELPIHSLELSQGQLPRVGIEAPATEVGLDEIAALEAARAFRTPELPASEEAAPPESVF